MEELTALKAEAYDLIATSEQIQNRLREINTKIQNYTTPAEEPTPEVTSE